MLKKGVVFHGESSQAKRRREASEAPAEEAASTQAAHNLVSQSPTPPQSQEMASRDVVGDSTPSAPAISSQAASREAVGDSRPSTLAATTLEAVGRPSTSASTQPTASQNKLLGSAPLAKKTHTFSGPEFEMKGASLILGGWLSDLISKVLCPNCHDSQLSVNGDTKARRGIVRKLVIQCSCGWQHTLSDPYTS